MDLLRALLEEGTAKVSFLTVAIVLATLLAFTVAFLLLWRLLKAKTLSEFATRFHLEQFYEMLYLAPDGYFSWFYDYDGKPPRQVCSRRFAVLFNLAKGEKAGFDEALAKVAQKDRESFRALVQKLRMTGENFATEIKLEDSSQRFIAIGCRGENAAGIVMADTIWVRDITKTSDSMDELYSENKYAEYKYNFVKAIVDSLPFPLWSRDEKLELNYCNRAYLDAVGATDPEEVAAKKIELAGGEALRKLKAMAVAARKEKQRVEAKEHIVLNKKRHYAQISEQFLEGFEGSFERSTVGMAIPMDEEDDLQAQLKGYMRAHDGVLGNLTTAIGIFGADTRLSFYNQPFLLLWGIGFAELDKKPTYSSFLEALREKRMTPEVRNFADFKAEESELFTTVVKPKEDLWHLPEGRTLRRFILPHPLGGLLISYEDVTDRLALESSYRTLIEVQKATIDNIHEAVVVINPEGHLKLYNAHYARLWEADEEFLKSAPSLFDVIEKYKPFITDNDSEWPAFKDALYKLLTEDKDTQFRLECLGDRFLDVAATRLADGGLLMTFEDVSKDVQREYVQQKRSKIMTKKNALRARFMSDLASEFKDPLVELCDMAKGLPSTYVFAEKAQNMAERFEDLMSLAMAEVGSASPDLKRVDVKNALEQVVLGLKNRAMRKMVEVAVEADEGLVLMVDEERFSVMLAYVVAAMTNLTYKGGTLAISAERMDNEEGSLVVLTFNPRLASDDDEDLPQKFFGAGAALILAMCALYGGSVDFERKGKFVAAKIILPAEK